jgi:hypothetical protein
MLRYGNRVIEEQEGNTVKITTEGYYDGLNSVKVETREDLITSRQTLLADVVKCLDLLKTESPDVTIRILKDKYGEPARIQKTWTVQKEKKK